MKKQRLGLGNFYILVAIFVLLCLSLFAVSGGSAWFSQSDKETLKILIDVNNVSLNVSQYQNSSWVRVGKTSYLTLAQSIEPNTDVPLRLKIDNNDPEGSLGLYVRFKVEIVIDMLSDDGTLTSEQKSIIPLVTLGENFTQRDDGFYYLGDNTANTILPSEGDQSVGEEMMTAFKLPLENFYDENGQPMFDKSQNIHVLITVQGSFNSTF